MVISYQIESESNPFFSFLPHRYGIDGYRLAGFDLEKIIAPGANVLTLASTVRQGSYGSTTALLRFQVYWAARCFLAGLVAMLDFLIPPMMKDFVVAYLRYLYSHKKKNHSILRYRSSSGASFVVGLLYSLVCSIVNIYCAVRYERSVFFEEMTLERASDLVKELRKEGEVLPDHIATIVSYNERDPVSLPRTPTTVTSINGDTISPAKNTVERYEKLIRREVSQEKDHSAIELERIINDVVKFIWWCYILDIKYVTIHEALGKLLLHRARLATRIQERLHISEFAQRSVKICCPSTQSCILINSSSESWETCNFKESMNDSSDNGLKVILTKIDSGYEPLVRKIKGFVEPFDCMTQSIQAVNSEELANSVGLYAAAHRNKRVPAPAEKSNKSFFEEVSKEHFRLGLLPQLMVLFGAQKMSEGFPLWTLADCILWQTPYSVRRTDKEFQLNQLMCAIREYADFKKQL